MIDKTKVLLFIVYKTKFKLLISLNTRVRHIRKCSLGAFFSYCSLAWVKVKMACDLTHEWCAVKKKQTLLSTFYAKLES